MPRDDFSARTKDLLSRRAGFHCSNPSCQHQTDGPAKGAIKALSIGEAAHICAAASGGARYDQTMTQQERADYTNGIWLCRNCAAMIDRDEGTFTVQVLHQWKEEAERRAWEAITGQEFNQGTHTEELTDDEQIVLFYLLSNGHIKTTKQEFYFWCMNEEIHEFDFENARILLESIDEDHNTIQIDNAKFRELFRQREERIAAYRTSINNHRRLASYTLREMWERFTDDDKLLFAYTRDINSFALGDRWKSKFEIASIVAWEKENDLDDTLSTNYSKALGILKDNEIVYESEWTSEGNARAYSMFNSAIKYILSEDISNDLNITKRMHTDLPF